MYPRVNIYLDRIYQNIIILKEKLKDIEIMGVTKGVCGDPKIAKLMVDGGIKTLGEARIENIIRLRKSGIESKIFQIRSPQISEIRNTVKYADGALITEIKIARALAQQSKLLGKKFGVIMMVELGDLREGVMPKDAMEFAINLKKEGLDFLGIGTNLGCFGGVIPTKEKLEELIELKDKLESNGIEVNVVSGGATDTLYLFENGRVNGITQLRLGEAILIGRDTTGNRDIEYLRHDTFIIEAEIVELKEKPSMPYGIIGKDAFGNIPKHIDRGIRKRAILAIGKQDIEFDHLIPLDKDVQILGGSSDHMVVDVNESEYEVGDIIQFYPLYPSILKFMCSKNKKRYIRGL